MLVLTRQVLLDVLNSATVAAVTSTIRGVPTEVLVGTEAGLKRESCVNLVNIFTVPQAQLYHYVGSIDRTKMEEVCRALNVAFGCE